MNPINNPYSPGAGSPPPELVGRDVILNDATVLLARARLKRSAKSMLLTGLRGVGKTVLLNRIKSDAIEAGYHAVSIEAYEDRPLGGMLGSQLTRLLHELDLIAGARSECRRVDVAPAGFLPAGGQSGHKARTWPPPADTILRSLPRTKA